MVFICSVYNKTPNNLDKSSEGRATANALNHTIRWCSFVVCTTKPHHNLDKSSEGRATANALNHTIRWCSFVVCTTKPHHNLDKSSEGRATANALNHTISSGVHTCSLPKSFWDYTYNALRGFLYITTTSIEGG